MSLKQPVQYPVKYYSYTDTDAPQLADADGVIKTILKACLVTGYGTKDSAGWTSLFEDDYRIVLRRPLGIGNPPDIKIENGVINGAASHRIVSQNNPTGLNDTTELAAVNLLARDSKHGLEWHLIVSDFAFVLCYQIGETGRTNDRNNMLFVGGLQKMRDADNEIFAVNKYSSVAKDGTSAPWLVGLLENVSNYNSVFVNMRSNAVYTERYFVNISAAETYYNNDYVAQHVMVGSLSRLPIFTALTNQYANINTTTVSINNRNMLRFINKTNVYAGRAMYIPLDYWEL